MGFLLPIKEMPTPRQLQPELSITYTVGLWGMKTVQRSRLLALQDRAPLEKHLATIIVLWAKCTTMESTLEILPELSPELKQYSRPIILIYGVSGESIRNNRLCYRHRRPWTRGPRKSAALTLVPIRRLFVKEDDELVAERDKHEDHHDGDEAAKRGRLGREHV